MTQLNISPTHVEQLRLQLKESLFIDLEDFGLSEQPSGEFSSKFIGVQLNSAFQPIYDSQAGELYGYEALLRPSLGGELLSSPEFALSYAENSGKLVQFDRVSRTLHVLNFRQIYAERGLLFLNVHPKLLITVNAHGKIFERILHANSVQTDRVVIEIQAGLIEHDKQLKEAIDNYRDRGYRIAIDNFGKAQSRIDRLWKFSPDFVKFDLSIIQTAASDERVRKTLPSLIKIVRDLGAQPVITGIESQAQLDIAIEAGGSLLQGYFLGKPMTANELQPSQTFRPSIKKGIKAAA